MELTREYLQGLADYFDQIAPQWEGPDGAQTPGTDLCWQIRQQLIRLSVEPMAADAVGVPPFLPKGGLPPAEASDVSEVTGHLVQLLRRRDAAGRKKYGTSLDRRDLSLPAWLDHMTEELLDAAGYAQAAKRTFALELVTVPSVPVVVTALLLVADTDPTEAVVATWSPEQRIEAYQWAMAVHFSASDNDNVVVPPRPDFIPREVETDVNR